MNLLTNNEANECVTLLINTLPACHFKNFIKCINNKDNWTSTQINFQNLDRHGIIEL